VGGRLFESTEITLQDSAMVPVEYEGAVAGRRRGREEDDLDVKIRYCTGEEARSLD
jgi:hypothetical protein